MNGWMTSPTTNNFIIIMLFNNQKMNTYLLGHYISYNGKLHELHEVDHSDNTKQS